VPKFRALGADGDDRVNDLLPFRMESRGDPWIGEHRPRCLGQVLGTTRAFCVAFDQIVDKTALPSVETGIARLRERLEGAKGLAGFFSRKRVCLKLCRCLRGLPDGWG